MRVLHLYRPRLPLLRAQFIQVIQTCHALARHGHRVTLLADGEPGMPLADALEPFGLHPHPNLDLRIAPIKQPGLAGLWFRFRVMMWWLGSQGVVLARDKKRLRWALRWLPERHRIVLETHELGADAHDGDPGPDLAQLERRCAAQSDAIVANCGGTLKAWQEAHGDVLPSLQRVIHNATASKCPPNDPAQELRILGSMRSYKGVDTIRAAAPRMPLPIHWIGATASEQSGCPSTQGLQVSGPVPQNEIPALLSAAALLLPLSDNRFGREMTSPLKLWDYLASNTPIVAPDLPSVREIEHATGVTIHTHRPDDPEDLIRAVHKALDSGNRTAHIRSWDDRAQELNAVFESLQ